jgi:hypothetical protein
MLESYKGRINFSGERVILTMAQASRRASAIRYGADVQDLREEEPRLQAM